MQQIFADGSWRMSQCPIRKTSLEAYNKHLKAFVKHHGVATVASKIQKPVEWIYNQLNKAEETYPPHVPRIGDTYRLTDGTVLIVDYADEYAVWWSHIGAFSDYSALKQMEKLG
jgi:hypothetical protein